MEIDYVNLLGLTLIAVGAPLLMDVLRLPIPDAVAMIMLGILVGGSGFGWIELDGAVELLSALGLAYLLFVAGLEVRVDLLRGRMLWLGLASFLLSCAIATGIGAALYATGLVDAVGVVVAALLTTSIGIVVVVLKDAGRLQTPVGQLSLLGALLGDVASVALLSVVFVGPGESTPGQLYGLGLFAVVGAVLAVLVLVASTVPVLREAVRRRLGGATQIAVRLSFAVMAGFAALAQALGPEAILGAFLAGVAVSAVSDHAAGSGATRDKLEVVGFGLLAPMFVVAAVQIGLARGGLRPSTASALIAAAIITVVTLPALASWVLRRAEPLPVASIC